LLISISRYRGSSQNNQARALRIHHFRNGRRTSEPTAQPCKDHCTLGQRPKKQFPYGSSGQRRGQSITGFVKHLILSHKMVILCIKCCKIWGFYVV
jgi:hypothetical protein